MRINTAQGYVEEHPLGFNKYIIFSFLGYRLRLHVWRKGAGVDYQHSHRWWFISIPLWGRFEEIRYDEVKGYTKSKFEVSDLDGVRDKGREFSNPTPSELIVRKKYTRYPFLPYFCEMNEIHSYRPKGKGFHASLVLISPLKTKTTNVWFN